MGTEVAGCFRKALRTHCSFLDGWSLNLLEPFVNHLVDFGTLRVVGLEG